MSGAGNALREMADRADYQGARAAAEAMGREAVAADREILGLSSHSLNTISPAPAGSPPSLVSGRLRGSIDDWLHIQHGPGLYETRVGPVNVVYSRIHELGGRTGKGHALLLPPRPYMRPATDQLTGSGVLSEVAASAFEKAVS